MLELSNQSNWQARVMPDWSREAKEQITVVIKAGFRFDLAGKLEPLEQTPEIEPVDRYLGEPGESSLISACETVPFKTGAEFFLTGTAHPPQPGACVMEVEASLRLSDGRDWQKILRISGRRHWQKKGLLGAVPSDPEPLEPLPLTYEHAFGGIDEARDKIFEQNPIGQGYAHRGRIDTEQPLPQIEQGPNYILRPQHQPAPAGFGAIPSHWQPRCEEQARIDEEAVAECLCPYPGLLPAMHYNAAPRDQRLSAPLVGGEALSLRGFFPELPGRQSLELTLPQMTPEAFVVLGDKWQRLSLNCDTLSVDTDARELYLLWRVGIPWAHADPRQGWVLLRDPAQPKVEAVA